MTKLPFADWPGFEGRGVKRLICVLLMTNSAALITMEVLKVIIEGQNTKNVRNVLVMNVDDTFIFC